MADVKHTPGPWEIGERHGKQALASANGDAVAYAAWDGGSRCHLEIENDADASLICAAPELLEALQDLFGSDVEYVLMVDGRDDQVAAIAKARAAIAKATGAAALKGDGS